MFLHLGADTIVPLRHVIAIFDLKANPSDINNKYLDKVKKQKLIEDISEGSPKSVVITDKKIFLSAISSLTLKKRADNIPDSEDEE